MIEIRDMPKLESPFVREIVKDIYVVTPKINESHGWVFEGGEKDIICTEKMDGTDVSVIIEDGRVKTIWNRMNKIEFFGRDKRIIESLLNAHEHGYLNLPDGQHFGECIGPQINGNPLQLKEHIWLPFNTYAKEHLAYKSWHKYPKTFENIRNWLLKPISEGGIFSLYAKKRGIELKPEGIVFHNLKTGEMSKLRLDMFSEFKGRRHNI